MNLHAKRFLLEQNYPNPFNASTEIHYYIRNNGKIQINILNSRGQEVLTLQNRNETAGEHTIRWNGKDVNGNDVTSGLYFCQIQWNHRIKTCKLILLR
ncbi:MAG: T9SS type A sorting domain-containing protein [Calditrichaeota bacterium]|nr:T9SS type A sorting domain-containing protein [Calditrichota bacterium]